jgi:hypothetical protein
VNEMCNISEQIYEDGMDKANRNVAVSLFKEMNFSIDEIVKMVL